GWKSERRIDRDRVGTKLIHRADHGLVGGLLARTMQVRSRFHEENFPLPRQVFEAHGRRAAAAA
ncbi:hypothetical protein ABTH29_20580, partial [Acinetobacter baumannii]